MAEIYLSAGSAKAGMWPLGLECGKLMMMMVVVVVVLN
jgi:hypothetical protein